MADIKPNYALEIRRLVNRKAKLQFNIDTYELNIAEKQAEIETNNDNIRSTREEIVKIDKQISELGAAQKEN